MLISVHQGICSGHVVTQAVPLSGTPFPTAAHGHARPSMESKAGMALSLRGSQSNEGDRCANRMTARVSAGVGRGGWETLGRVRGFLEVVAHEANRTSKEKWVLRVVGVQEESVSTQKDAGLGSMVHWVQRTLRMVVQGCRRAEGSGEPRVAAGSCSPKESMVLEDSLVGGRLAREHPPP